MIFPKYFISCDWGTSNFRLRLVETETLKVISEKKTDQGIKTLYEEFKTSKSLSQKVFFANYLKNKITELPVEHQNHIILMAGMASSNIGLQNLNYADFPFNLDGSSLTWKYLETENKLNILLISGVKCASGMMRGEEIQAVGLEEYLIQNKKGILLLPGTHSKHIRYEKEKFVSLKNFMTGELFDLLSNKSILSNSVLDNSWSSTNEVEFKKGVLLGKQNKLTANLFNVRVRDVLENMQKEENYYYLSGMLIGDELSYLQEENSKVILAAPKPLFDMYKIALEMILTHEQLIFLDDKTLKKALLKGQRKILKLYETK